MPVQLIASAQASSTPQPPRPIAWLLIAIGILVTCAVWTLLTWTKGEPTGTAPFWLRLLGLPAFLFLLAYGFRLLYYEQELARLQAEDDVLAEDRAKAIQFAQEPLSVLASAYACAFDGNAEEMIVARQSLLKARRPLKGKAAIRHTALTQFKQTLPIERYRLCFAYLLGRLSPTLHTLPAHVPLHVYLQVPDRAQAENIHAVWQNSWEAAGLPAINAELLPSCEGVMTLDAWLDIHGGPALEKVALFVAVQLHELPPPDSAEAAVALLLGWAPLIERKGLAWRALLHRPVEDTFGSVNETISRALLWGNAEAASIKHVWQAGLDHADRAASAQASADLSLGVPLANASDGAHDIDAAIGHAGVASAWLAIAMAVEHAWQTRVPQLVVSREHTFRAAVVQPLASHQEPESQG